MEDYKKIYPELLSKEPPKDCNAFRLQESCRVLENLEKESKTLLQVSGKSTKDVTTYCPRTSTLSGTLSFLFSGSGVEQHFLGLACLSPHHLEALVLFVEL